MSYGIWKRLKLLFEKCNFDGVAGSIAKKRLRRVLQLDTFVFTLRATRIVCELRGRMCDVQLQRETCTLEPDKM